MNNAIEAAASFAMFRVMRGINDVAAEEHLCDSFAHARKAARELYVRGSSCLPDAPLVIAAKPVLLARFNLCAEELIFRELDEENRLAAAEAGAE